MIVTSSGSYVEGDDVCRVNEYSTRGCVDTMPCSARAYRGKAREGTTRNDTSWRHRVARYLLLGTTCSLSQGGAVMVHQRINFLYPFF